MRFRNFVQSREGVDGYPPHAERNSEARVKRSRRAQRVMLLYIFISIPEPRVRAITPDKSGENLPAAYAPWRPAEGGSVMRVISDAIAKAIDRDGYFLVSMSGRRQPNCRSPL
jgi:hypothetical protein